MAKLLCLLVLGLLGLTLAYDEKEVERELRALEEITNDDDSSRNGLTDKLKELCTCASHKECTCCMKHSISFPIVGEAFSPKACAVFQVQPDSKLLDVKVALGPFTAFQKQVSWQPFEQKCKKIEQIKGIQFNNLEVCGNLDIAESAEKGLSACVRVKLQIADLFNRPINFPCVNFKDEKLTVDSSFEGAAEGSININIKDLWGKLTG